MTTKIAVSLPDDLVEHARQMVREGRAASVSAAVATALLRDREQESLRTVVDNLLAETGGPLSAHERGEARRDLGLA